MKTQLSREQLNKAQKDTVWTFGNKILYDLCRDNFIHTEDKRILTKVLFIGRIYAAAVERRSNKEDGINDQFYIGTIAPTFRKSKLDKHLSEIKNIKKLTDDNVKTILQTHFHLTTILNQITEQDKRSFSSKYLHFHLPELFFIYDSRSLSALRHFVSRVPKDLKHILKCENIDKDYATFFCKCFALKRHIEKQYKTTLSNRHLDNLLLEISAKKNKEATMTHLRK